MDLEQLKQILDLVRAHELSEFEIEHDGLRLRVRKDTGGVIHHHVASHVAAPVSVGSPVAVPSATPAALPQAVSEDDDFTIVKSPIVGTFYRAPEPSAPSFVEIGTAVKKGQVLCIIEAMKLMNEIDSEFDGEVVRVFVENGQAVQFGERLFAIKTA